MAEAIINRKGSPIRAIFAGIRSNDTLNSISFPELIGAKNAVITLVKQRYSQSEYRPISSIVIEDGKVTHVTVASSSSSLYSESPSVVKFYPNWGSISITSDIYSFPINYNPINDSFQSPSDYFCVVY